MKSHDPSGSVRALACGAPPLHVEEVCVGTVLLLTTAVYPIRHRPTLRIVLMVRGLECRSGLSDKFENTGDPAVTSFQVFLFGCADWVVFFLGRKFGALVYTTSNICCPSRFIVKRNRKQSWLVQGLKRTTILQSCSPESPITSIL